MSIQFPLIGIMQGRLSRPQQGKIQSFPWNHWQQEFFRAKEIGLQLIEFVYDYHNNEQNPLMTSRGCAEIMSLVDETGVVVRSVCADYFMEKPIHSASMEERKESISLLEFLISQAKSIGVTNIIIPCVDQSSLRSEGDAERLKNALENIHPILEKSGINIALETDLSPQNFLKLLMDLNLPCVTVNYDTGNSASLGYSAKEELAAYGRYISSIHIKDRVLGGSTVQFGKGSVNFTSFFKELKRVDYPGFFIIQGARGNDDVDVVLRQFNFLQAQIRDNYLAI